MKRWMSGSSSSSCCSGASVTTRKRSSTEGTSASAATSSSSSTTSSSTSPRKSHQESCCVHAPATTVLVRSSSILGGYFHGEHVQLVDRSSTSEESKQQQQQQQQLRDDDLRSTPNKKNEDSNNGNLRKNLQSLVLDPSQFRGRSLSLPYLSEISGCEGDFDGEDDDLLDGDDDAADENDDDDEESTTWHTTTDTKSGSGSIHQPPTARDDDCDSSETAGGDTESVLRAILDALTEDEVEIAARSSYAYAKLSKTKSNNNNAFCCRKRQMAAAVEMARRHLVAEKGDAKLALHKMKQTLQHRPRIDAIRECFEHDDESSQQTRQRVQHYLGPNGRMFVRGYDHDGRAIFHFIVSNSPKNVDLAEGCVDSHYYILERAFACTERRSNGTQSTVIVSVDFAGFQKWQAPPLSCVREMLDMLQNHYPERLHRVYLVNAPRLFLYLWNIIKPFVDPHTKTKFQFVDHMEQVLDADQAMPYQRPDGQFTHAVDMDKFYRLPYDHAYDE